MKTTLLFSCLLFTTLSFAQSSARTFEALIRNDDHNPVVEQVALKDLISNESFDGAFFKIVRGKSEEAIRFDADRELRFRAASSYYHLTKAREYFITKLNSDYVKSIPKMTIRIDHTNQFSELGHFAHDNLEPQFNNALTIPAGKSLRGNSSWGMEIWFRPSKKIHLRDLKVNDLANQEFKVLMNTFRDQVHMQSMQRFMQQAATAVIKDGPSPLSMDSLVRTVGASLMIEVGMMAVDPLTKLFSRKWYWLDTALVPEIIYHEYAHAALSDHLVLSHSTAIIEGMADFFAGQIADSPKLANNIKKYNTYNGKNAKRKQEYMIQFETTEYANTDFVFGLLWSMKKIVGEEKSSSFMYELRKKITTNSTIRGQLIEGLLESCEETCTEPFNDRLKILKSLNKKGI